MGDYAYELAHDGVFRDQVLWLTATLGAVGDRRRHPRRGGRTTEALDGRVPAVGRDRN
jgi:hypothetical protein